MTSAVSDPSGPKETRFVEMVFPGEANHYGTLFGGTALQLMSKAAFVAATRHARCKVVMARSEQVAFDQPVQVGEMVELVARVTHRKRSSMKVSVEMIREELISGRRATVVRGTFEMVAVNASGRPIRIPAPDHIPSTCEEMSS